MYCWIIAGLGVQEVKGQEVDVEDKSCHIRHVHLNMTSELGLSLNLGTGISSFRSKGAENMTSGWFLGSRRLRGLNNQKVKDLVDRMCKLS